MATLFTSEGQKGLNGPKGHPWRKSLLSFLSLLSFFSLAHAAETEAPWFDKKWPTRRSIVIDTSDKGLPIKDPIGNTVLLLRLSDNNYSFDASTEDGRDLRIVADDHKTALKHHVEKWDVIMHEAYVWVQVPDLKPAAATTLWLYYGNVTDAASTADAKQTWEPETTSAYHFSDATDASTSGVAITDAGSPVASSLAAGGLRVLGQVPISIPDAPTNEWTAGAALTWSAWFKPTALQPNAILFSRRDGANSFVISIDNGTPFVEINKQKSTAGTALTPAQWHHLAIVIDGGNTTVYLDGTAYGTLVAGLPAMKGACIIGKDSIANGTGFVGELDELRIARLARPAGWAKFATVAESGSSDAQKLVVVNAEEAANVHKPGMVEEHVHLITDISKDLTPDGWLVIGLCTILAVVGWIIALGKLLYLNKINKADEAFLEQWEKVSSDLTALEDDEGIKSLGGAATGKKSQKLMHQSPLYHIYHLGCMEVKKRTQDIQKISLNPDKPRIAKGLSGRSIQAIKATLHGGLMREVQKLNGKLVFLTIGIAGGPYLGLLGTVIGVMITFAVIAKSGQVEVNSIAPGIAGALLATVAGLAVAIPALFAYSYLSTRIKDAITDMETFIDEFIAKMAEHYKE